jgi:Fe2+ transport system protein FeoA
MLTFLSEVMFMEDEQVAEDLACGLEHHLDAELFSKFEELSEFFRENPSIKKAFRDYLAEKGPVKGKRLCEVPSESEVRVRKLGGVKEDKDKLISMGILPGMTLEVEENSLSNDLMRIRIRGFSMTMTCEDAQKVVVTIL